MLYSRRENNVLIFFEREIFTCFVCLLTFHMRLVWSLVHVWYAPSIQIITYLSTCLAHVGVMIDYLSGIVSAAIRRHVRVKHLEKMSRKNLNQFVLAPLPWSRRLHGGRIVTRYPPRRCPVCPIPRWPWVTYNGRNYLRVLQRARGRKKKGKNLLRLTRLGFRMQYGDTWDQFCISDICITSMVSQCLALHVEYFQRYSLHLFFVGPQSHCSQTNDKKVIVSNFCLIASAVCW